MCSLGFFFCGFNALRQLDAKKIVAYSSVVHMNLVVLAIFSNTFKGLVGAVLMMVAHGLTSSGFFFSLIGVFHFSLVSVFYFFFVFFFLFFVFLHCMYFF